MKYVLLSMALTLLVSCAKEENTNIDISKKVSDAYPSISIDKIRKIDDKFHELIINNQVYYATNDGKYLIVGNVIDLDTKESITENTKMNQRLSIIDSINNENFVSVLPISPIKYFISTSTDISFKI